MERLFWAIPMSILIATSAAQADAGHKKHKMATSQEQIMVAHPWVRATPPRAKNGAAYLKVTNHGKTVEKIISASTPVANKAEIHTHLNEAGVMKMRHVPSLDIPAGGSMTFAPGGHHVMLIGLKKTLKVGDKVAITLVFEKAGKITFHADITKSGAKMGRAEVIIHSVTPNGVGGPLGTIILSNSTEGFIATPHLNGLSAGKHAFHVHMNGDCSPGIKDGIAVAALAAGGHYGHMAKHGHGHTKKHEEPHKMAGDMPDLTVGADGRSMMAVVKPGLTMAEIRGRALMIHSGPTMAHGKHAGGDHRIACGVIPK